MPKFTRLLVLLLLTMLVIVPVDIFAQDMSVEAEVLEDVVMPRLLEYGENLPDHYGTIRVEPFVELMIENEDVVVLDVREDAEVEETGVIEGSIHIPMRELGYNLDLLPDLDATIVVVCKGGFRATIAMTALHVLGYDNAHVLVGGFGSWVGEDYPVVEAPADVEPAEVPADIDPLLVEFVAEFMETLPEGWGAVGPDALFEEMFDEMPDLLLDVRSESEWIDTGYIDGATHIWIDEFTMNLDMLPEDMDASIVVYCASGYRGNVVATMLRMMGYTNVRNLAGGINGWLAADLPVVTDEVDSMEDVVMPRLLEYGENLPDHYGTIRVEPFVELMIENEDVVVLDVREDAEVEETGVIEGSIHIPMRELGYNLDLLPDLDATIVVVCKGGFRATIAMTALHVLGYDNAHVLVGGFGSWVGEDYPVVEAPADVEPAEVPADIDPLLVEFVAEFMETLPEGWGAVGPDALFEEMFDEMPDLLLDVRSESEWIDTGYIDGATHIWIDEFTMNLDMLPEDMDASIVVYCASGYRGNVVATMLRMMGYTNVRNLAGGINGWLAADLPVVMD